MASLREIKKRRTRQAIVARALDLFADEGYDAVTMAAIARAADVGERTVYRYFVDKEEMLFADDGQMRAALNSAIAAQSSAAGPVAVVRAAAHAVAALLEDQRPQLQHRMLIIEATPALQARNRVKQAGHQQLISEQLVERGLRPERARLAGTVGVVCFNEGLARWLTHADRPLREEIDAAFDELATLTP